MANFRQQFITKCVGAGEKTGNQEANEAGLMEVGRFFFFFLNY